MGALFVVSCKEKTTEEPKVIENIEEAKTK